MTPDHRHPGGVAGQVALYTGFTGPYNQYFGGTGGRQAGAWGQMCEMAGPTAAGITYNQYAAGGVFAQFLAAATGPAGVTGFQAAGDTWVTGMAGPTGQGP
jgi:hypothetical protein